MSSVGRSSRRWLAGLAALGAALVAVCAIYLIWQVLSMSLGRDQAGWVRIVIAAAGVSLAIATVAAGWDSSSGSMFTDARIPKNAGLLIVGLYAALGVMATAITLFAPQNATESHSGAIENKIDALVPKPAPKARVLGKIAGSWGEPGCDVTYRISRIDDALTIDSIRRPPGTTAWHGVGTIVSSQGDQLKTSSVLPRRGLTSTIDYRTNGVTEELHWDAESKLSPVILYRC